MRTTLTEEHIKARVRQLLALASSSSSRNEKRLASIQAEKLMKKHGITKLDVDGGGLGEDDREFTYSDNPLTTNAQSFILSALCIAHNVAPRYTLLAEDSRYFTRKVTLSGGSWARKQVRRVYESIIRECRDELDRLDYHKSTVSLNSIYCGVAESLLSRLPPPHEDEFISCEPVKVVEPPTRKHLFDEGVRLGDTLSFSTLLQLEQVQFEQGEQP